MDVATLTCRLSPAQIQLLKFAEHVTRPRACKRIAAIANLLGRTIGLADEELFALFCGSYLFDIGKIAIPESVWRKPGRLTPEEFGIMKTHTARGFEICRPIEVFAGSLPIVRHHHERWDGTGYPDRLCGEAIPLLARLLQIIDIYDALTANRPYRRGSTHEEAIIAMRTSGQLDPDLVCSFSGLSPSAHLEAEASFAWVTEVFKIPPDGAALQNTEFYSCFISHSSRDVTLVKKLNSDLVDAGIKSWYAPNDLKTGDMLRPKIDRTIRLYDRLLLVLSASSIKSPWVESEVEAALDEERHRRELPEEFRGDPLVVFPIRIDNSIFEIQSGWPALIKRTRHIADLTSWQNPVSYQGALDRLIRDLVISDEVDTKARAARREAGLSVLDLAPRE